MVPTMVARAQPEVDRGRDLLDGGDNSEEIVGRSAALERVILSRVPTLCAPLAELRADAVETMLQKTH